MRSTKQVTLQLEQMPIGITKSLLDELELCSKITTVSFVTDCNVYSKLSSFEKITNELLQALFIDFLVEDDLAEAFKKYIEFYIDTQLDKIIYLNKCWSIEE